MKIVISFLLALFFSSCSYGKDRVYIGSTPANHVVRSFLGIPFTDSVDFIRWKITMQDNKYILRCNYGIGKPNTNTFINNGKWIELNGGLKKERNYYNLQYDEKKLKMVELNYSLLHLLNDDNSLLIGNGGWSYTLNIDPRYETSKVSLVPKSTSLKDSMAFEGRTPCGGFSDINLGAPCYKLKWSIIFYSDPISHTPAGYKLSGTAYRKISSRTGTWKIITAKDGKMTYQLNSGNGSEPLYLLKLDENILIFTNKQGNLLVGNEDFSYTLNRRW